MKRETLQYDMMKKNKLTIEMTINVDCVGEGRNYASKDMLKSNWWAKEVNWYQSGDILRNFSRVIYHLIKFILHYFIIYMCVCVCVYVHVCVYVCVCVCVCFVFPQLWVSRVLPSKHVIYPIIYSRILYYYCLLFHFPFDDCAHHMKRISSVHNL